MKRIISLVVLALIFSVNTIAQAVLPTSWSFDNATLPTGWTESGTAFYTGSGNTPPAMKFDNTGDYLVINFASAPGNLTYYLTGNGFSGGTFTVEESQFGSAWTVLHTFTAPPNGSYSQFTDSPLSTTRYIRFIYTNKSSGNIGLDDVSIAMGAASPEQEINVKNGATTIISGGSFSMNSPVSTMTPVNFTVENLGTANTLNISSAVLSGPNAADFNVSVYPSTVAALGSETLTLEFTPAAAGTRTAVLTINSNDTDESAYVINLNCIGGNFATEPTSQASNLVLTNVKTYRLSGSFTPSTAADGYLVLRKKGSAITGLPVDGMVYQRGDIVGDAQVVFSSNSTSFVPNNINASNDYYFAVFAYNGNGTFRNYLTTAPALANVTTPATMVSGTYYNGISTSNPTFLADLHALTNPHQMQFYSNYGNLMIKQFATRDTTLNRRVVTCVYSGENKIYTEPFDFTANGFSREHTFPHSWMPTNPAQNLPEYNDYHHLFPTNQNQVNALRSNFPLGEVVTVQNTYLGAKYGLDANGNTVFEPRDEHKGDAARAMMYESVAYTTVSGNSWAFPSFISGFIPYGQDQDVLKEWNLMDAPDSWEISRNDYLDSLQGNRNPFVDHPEYACFIDFSNMTYHAQGCNIGLEENSLNEKLSVYPIPANNELTIAISESAIVAYSIIDIHGREVVANNNLSTFKVTVDVSGLKAGTYIVKVATTNGVAQKQLIID